jgi:hypothetical protein
MHLVVRPIRRRLRLVWSIRHAIARRADGTPFDNGGYPLDSSVRAHQAADAINRNLRLGSEPHVRLGPPTPAHGARP